MADFVNLFPGWIGFFGEELGVVLAARNNGEELMFACKDQGRPLRWIKYGEFCFHPDVIIHPGELRKPPGS